MRKIKMEKIAEVIRLHFKLDLSVRQTSSALNVSRSSVGDYCQKFKYLNLDVDDFLKLSIEKQEELLGQVEEFFTLRLKNIFLDREVPHHVIDLLLSNN